MSDAYDLTEPSAWPGAPKAWSSSSLERVIECPRRWQLIAAQWGDMKRFPERPHWKAVEGQLIHAGVDRLLRACAEVGNPPIGSELFRGAANACGFHSFFDEELKRLRKLEEEHPRGRRPGVMSLDGREVKCKAMELVRAGYVTSPGSHHGATTAQVSGSARSAFDESNGDALHRLLESRGGLSEIELHWRALGFMGKVDRVALSGRGEIEVLDFKSGKEDLAHVRQLQRYAVLWWKVTGRAPARVGVVHLKGRVIRAVERGDLETWAAELESACDQARRTILSTPAPARTHDPERCRRCPVRARCDEGWGAAQSVGPDDSWTTVDMEVTVTGLVTRHALTGRLASGADVQVTYEGPLRRNIPLPDASDGARLRILGAEPHRLNDGKGFGARLRAWTEVFVV